MTLPKLSYQHHMAITTLLQMLTSSCRTTWRTLRQRRGPSSHKFTSVSLVHLFGEKKWKSAILLLMDLVRASTWLPWLHSFPTVQDFNPIKPLVDHALNKIMHCNSSEHPILVTEPAWNTPFNRERMAEIMFEEFNVPAFYIANTGVLNAYLPICLYFLLLTLLSDLLLGKALLS